MSWRPLRINIWGKNMETKKNSGGKTIQISFIYLYINEWMKICGYFQRCKEQWFKEKAKQNYSNWLSRMKYHCQSPCPCKINKYVVLWLKSPPKTKQVIIIAYTHFPTSGLSSFKSSKLMGLCKQCRPKESMQYCYKISIYKTR